MRQRNNGERSSDGRRSLKRGLRQIASTALATLAFAGFVRGDIVEMTNGDHYSGTVLSVNLTNVTLKSDIQGAVNLPRGKVASIVFGSVKLAAPLAQAHVPSTLRPVPGLRIPASTNAAGSNLVNQIQEQLLAGAGPEAVNKYNQMMGNFLSGKLTVADLRKQAQQTLSAVEEAKKDAGPETDDVLEGYLSILRAFVEQSGQE